MENRLKHSLLYCFRYWVSCNQRRVALLCAIILYSLFVKPSGLQGMGLFEMVCLYFISTSTQNLFSQLNVSLPFSRKELWDFHFWMQSILLGGYLAARTVAYRPSYGDVMILLICVLIAYYLEADLPTDPGKNTYIIFLFIFISAEPLLLKMEFFKRMAAGSSARWGAFGVILVAGLLIDLLHWQKKRKAFVSYTEKR